MARSRPVWVVGSSRSGTTLVHAILDRTPELHMLGETHFFDDLRPRIGAGPLDEAGHRTCRDYLLALDDRPYGHAGDPARSPIDGRELEAAARRLGDGPEAWLEAWAGLRCRAAGKPRWGDKTPRHVFCIPQLFELDPTSQVLCMVRDPRAVVLSYRDWVHRRATPGELPSGHRDQLDRENQRLRASYHVALQSLLWRGSVRAAHSAVRRFGPERVRIVQYERLVAEGPGAARDLLDWLGVDFDPSVLDVPLQNSSFERFDPAAGLSAAPIDRWRAQLAPREIAAVERVCGRVLAEAGYAAVSPRRARIGAARELATLPLAAVRAGWANRERIPALPRYAAARLRYAFGAG